MPDNDDAFIGETFEDRDPRSVGRRIRVTELHPKQHNPRHDPDEVAYRAIRVDELGHVVGWQRVRVKVRTLRTKYRKVSH